jgi:hypothetical protein
VEIFSLVGSPSELKLLALETILHVIAVNFAIISAVTLVVCLTNLLLSFRGARN